MNINEDILITSNDVIIKLELDYFNPRSEYDDIQKVELKQKLVSLILGNNNIVNNLLKRKNIIIKIND